MDGRVDGRLERLASFLIIWSLGSHAHSTAISCTLAAAAAARTGCTREEGEKGVVEKTSVFVHALSVRFVVELVLVLFLLGSLFGCFVVCLSVCPLVLPFVRSQVYLPSVPALCWIGIVLYCLPMLYDTFSASAPVCLPSLRKSSFPKKAKFLRPTPVLRAPSILFAFPFAALSFLLPH
ncbi:uncharacterized protein J3D65DRAFT_242589 [Phyllosticta citribraziliensis]|uniref:Transmembrane protein n=1 Tax=Phyllosticta citribraziliensis TaxID=989973 RepID=A0ABR1M1B0_9PEZI